MKKKQVSIETRVRISIASLIKSEDPVKYLSTARLIITPDHYGDAITQIERYPNKITNLLSPQFKKVYKELDFHNLQPIPFDNELTWAKSILFRNADYLNEFIQSSSRYSNELLKGNYKKANEILVDIENKFGQSIWLIKNKIAFIQLTEGLEQQKRYTQKVKEELRDRSLVKFVIHWVSIRNEGKTTLNRFFVQFEPIINRFDPKKLLGFKDYCKYHVLGIDNLKPEEFVNVLRLEYSRSLIDYYEAFISLLRIILISDEQKLKSKITHILDTVPNSIKDPRLNLFNSILRDTKPFPIIKKSIESCDLFLKGNYKESYITALEGINLLPDNPLLILMASHSKAMLIDYSSEKMELEENKSVTPINTLLINNLAEVISKGPIAASKELNDLNKLSINFNCFQWSSIINIILSQETTIFLPQNAERILSILKIHNFHPLLIELTQDTSIYNTYLKTCSDACKNTMSIEYALAKEGQPNNLSNYELGNKSKSFLNAILNFNNKEYLKTIIDGRYLASTAHGYFNRKGIGLVSHSYLKTGDLKNACISTAEFYLKDKNNFPFLPLNELYQAVKPGTDQWDDINALIDFPIILDAFVKHINSSGETERRFAYEDFLTSNGILRPSELKGISKKFDHNKLIYYLRYICIEANMDTSLAFEGGSKEIISERLSVCKLLAEIDPPNTEDYQKEINELVKRQIITSRRQEVDQSRIYIDITSVKEWVMNNGEESYDRYIAYRKHGLEFDDSKKKITESTKDFEVLPNILIPENEVNELLEDIVEEIISAYLSPEFGLDRFLSTRIRHGILENHLRKPIAKHNLITKKEFKQGPYLPNDYWLKKLNVNNLPVSKELNKMLSDFSLLYDDLILKITSEWLQIKSKKKQKGLFNFQLNEQDIINIADIIKPETSFNEFIDIVINILESALIIHLATIRKELYEKAKPEAKLYLKELQDKISNITSINTTELHGAINQARTDMQAQFDKIIEWFVPSASGNSSPFAVEDAIRVAETFIVDSSPTFKIVFVAEGLDDFLIHGNLPIFVDIFVNIFDNVVKRSGLETPIAHCQVWADNSNPNLNLVYFKICNDLNLNREISGLELELKRKKELLEFGDYTQYVSSEGNSGLFKIHKSVSELRAMEFNQKATMDFGIEGSKFQILICVPFRVFKLDDEE